MLRLVLCCVLLSPFPAVAQDDSLLCTTEFHLGLGAQKFFHFGGRYHFGNGFLAEADLGIAPIASAPASYSLGLAILPQRSMHTEGGTFYSLIYSHLSSALFNSRHSFIRLLSLNIGILSQHSEGSSYQIRAGAGIGQDNLFIPRGEGIPDHWEISYFPWGNLEVSVGFAF